MNVPEFSDHERSVLWGTFRGKTLREIWACNGELSDSAIKRVRKEAFAKLGARNAIEAVIKLKDMGWK